MQGNRYLCLGLCVAWFLVLCVSARAYVELDEKIVRNFMNGSSVEQVSADNLGDLSTKGGQLLLVEHVGPFDGSYYLYLPTAFDGTNECPVIMFHPSAPSGLGSAVTHIKHAEDRGWIIVSFHEMGNLAGEDDDRRTWDILRHFKANVLHDGARVYVSGASGGSCRAYEMARNYRGAFAGNIDHVGWMCLYDNTVRYPERLAVAHLVGQPWAMDGGYAAEDRRILERDGVRREQFHGNFGHKFAPAPLIDKALDWLEEDYGTNGTRYVDPEAEAKAQALLEQTTESLDKGDFSEALLTAGKIVAQYAYTTAWLDVHDMMLDIAEHLPLRPPVEQLGDMDWLPELQKCLYHYALAFQSPGFEPEGRLAYAKLAHWVLPQEGMARLLLADELQGQTYCSVEELAYARELVREPLDETVREWWRTPNTRAKVDIKRGELRTVSDNLTRAYRLHEKIYDDLDWIDDMIDPVDDAFSQAESATISGDHQNYFLLRAIGGVANDLSKLHVPCHPVSIGQEAALAGRFALRLDGNQTFVRMNLAPATAPFFIEYYTIPVPGEPADLSGIYDFVPYQLKFDPSGRLWATSKGQGYVVTSYTAPTRDPTWIRIQLHVDPTQGRYHVSVNGQVIASDLRLDSPDGQLEFFVLQGVKEGPTYIDALRIHRDATHEDYDLDALDDTWESNHGLNDTQGDGPQGANGDPDDDGLSNLEEYLWGTHPTAWDTDGDGLADGDELFHGMDPLENEFTDKLRLPAQGGSSGGFRPEHWLVSGSPNYRVREEDGTSWLQLDPSHTGGTLTRFFEADRARVVWVTLKLQPTPGFGSNAETTFEKGAALLFLNPDGHLVLFDGHPSIRQWITLEHPQYPLDQAITVNIRLDYETKTWSVWEEGKWLARDLGFANPAKHGFSSISIAGTGKLAAFEAAPYSPDQDNDLIPDDWEYTYHGGTHKTDETTDTDGDGFTDRSEYLAGTDPYDPESNVQVKGVFVEGDRLIVVWDGSGRNYEANPIAYRLLRTTDLNKPFQSPVSCEFYSDGVHCEFDVPLEELDGAIGFFTIGTQE